MVSQDDTQKRRTVPKFGSFKPTTSAIPTTEKNEPPGDATPANTQRRDGEPSKNRERRATKDGHGRLLHRHRSRERRRTPSPTLDATKPRKEEESPRGMKAPADRNLFVIDTKGDPLILRYGTNDRSRVPSYRRLGRGKLMGTARRFEVHQIGSKEEWSFREHRDAGSLFRDRHFLTKLAGVKSKRIKQEPDCLPEVDEGFIPLFSSRKRKRKQDTPSSSDSDDMPNYRSIHGKSKPEDFVDSDVESGSDSSPGPADDLEISTARKQSVELSRRVREQPGDIRSWLELIRLQDTLLREDTDGRAKTQDEIKGLADVKTSLFEKALPHASLPTERERLLIGLMREGRRVWDGKTLAKRWREVSADDSNSFALWKERLDFELTNLTAFSYEGIRTYLLDQLRLLKQRISEVAGEQAVTASQQAIYVFLRLTRFLYDSGYSEQAAAAWQALLEMNFFRPDTIEDAESAVASFSGFWESEAPRIGEEGAQGWRQFTTADTMPDPSDQKEERPPLLPDTRDQYKAWAAVENARARNSRFPARTLDEGTEDDPYRVVMFSDIKDMLIWFPTSLLPRLFARLQDAFLVFCGLPTASSQDEIVTPQLEDAFTTAQCRTIEAEPGRTPEPSQCLEDSTTKHPSFTANGSCLALSPETLFSGHHWFQSLPQWGGTAEGDAQVPLPWVIGVLRQMVHAGLTEQLAEYYLALEWTSEPSKGRKVAKALLKQYPSHVRLYNAYALIEWANGKVDISKKVLSSATGQNWGSSQSSNQLLWNTWVWMELEAGTMRLAVARLCKSVDSDLEDGADISPGLLMKAKLHFTSARDSCLWNAGFEKWLEHAESAMLLEYLAGNDGAEEAASDTQGNISAALATFEKLSRELASRGLEGSTYHERLSQSAARLLYYHATHGPFRPAYLRDRLRDFVKLFPRNTVFLRLFAWVGSGLRIDDPVRTLLEKVVLVGAQDCTRSRLFAIQHELTAGTVHSCKAAFEDTLESEACRGNVNLWICYIRFSYTRKELRRKAKDVFHRAVAVCPWSKELYMESFTTLAKEFSSSELRSVFNTISNKGLRVHIDLGDFLEQWKGKQEDKQAKIG